MRITSKGRYGLKALIELGKHYEQGLLKSREIAERQEIPIKYLEQIISTLKKNHFVKSVRGAEGGYSLAKSPQEISVYDILLALEGDLSIIDRRDTALEQNAGLFWAEVEDAAKKILDVPLSDFISAGQRAEESYMYYI